MRKIPANGINFHYQQHGQGSDVVLVHGVFSNLSYWVLTLLPKLMERHRVTIYDLRGHGFSDVTPTGYATADHADDLNALMDALGIERAHVVGHSYGGAIAMHFAVRYPERLRSLVIADSVFPALRPYVSLADWPRYQELRDLVSPWGIQLPDDPDSWDVGAILPELTKIPTVNGLRRGLPFHDRRLQRLRETTTCLDDLLVEGDLTEERIRAVAAPTLAIISDWSPFLAVCRYLEEHLPSCRALLVEGGDHFFPASARESFADQLLEHFSSADRGATPLSPPDTPSSIPAWRRSSS